MNLIELTRSLTEICARVYFYPAFLFLFFFTKIFASCEYLCRRGMNIYAATGG